MDDDRETGHCNDKMPRMDERQEFLKYFRSEFIKMVERLDTMTESQVLDGIAEVRAARTLWKEEVTERVAEVTHSEPQKRPKVAGDMPHDREQIEYLISIQAFFSSVNKLRMRTGAKAPPLGGPGFDLLENALNKRLELLKSGPSNES